MTQISPLTGSPPPASGGQRGDRRVLSSDFETFLKMLTAQIRNQDPLEPMPSADFAVQLATFSSVEQQMRTNTLLETFLGSAGGGLAEAGRWVGMEALTSASVVFDGRPVDLHLSPDPKADAAILVVRDGTGREVERRGIDPQATRLTWQGTSAQGTPFLHGSYSFQAVSLSDGMPLATADARAYGRIVEARLEGGAPVLVLSGGASVAASAVAGLRMPSGG